MTAICGGGTSSAQPGYGEALYMVPSMVGALLNNIPTIWAVPLAGFIGAVTYNLSTFCSNDPPSVPTFTATDVVNLLNPYNPGPYNDAQDKFQQLVGAYAWYQVCQCDSVTTPAPPTPPAAPTGMPSINPPQVAPSYPLGQPCSTFDWGTIHVTGTFTGTNPQIPVDGITYVTVDLLEQSRAPTTSDHAFFQIVFRSSAGASLGTPCSVGFNGVGGPTHNQAAVPAGTVTLEMQYGDTIGFGSPADLHAAAAFYCGSQPGGTIGVAPQPCPSDPFVLALLEQILALTTIIQRQAAPFAYIASTVHSGLSGEGHIAVSDLLGVKVQLDTWGTGVGQEAGDPDEWFDAGWITWGNADGSTKREWITHSPFVSLPQLAGQFTRVGYTLGQGVSATITELVRES